MILKTYYNEEAGYHFSYPGKFYLEGQERWGLRGEDIVSINIMDSSQKPYVYKPQFTGGRPQGLFPTMVEEMQVMYPEYHIRVLVSKDPSLYMLSYFPLTESRHESEDVSIGGQTGAVYVAEERPPTHDIYTYSKVTTMAANALYYILQYECVCGPTGIKEINIFLYIAKSCIR